MAGVASATTTMRWRPGERAAVLVMAADRRQARTIVRYLRALVDGVPMLATLIER